MYLVKPLQFFSLSSMSASSSKLSLASQTWIHWVAQLGSVFLFFAFSLIYNIACAACSPPSNPYFVMETVIQTGNYWFSIMLSIAVSLFPRSV